MSGISYDDEPKKSRLGKDDECPIQGTELCYWLGGKGFECDKCYAHGVRDSESRIKMAERWKITLSNIPDNIDDLSESDTCFFCKGEPRKKEYYASLDLAHPEPRAKKGIILGLGKKITAPVGSMMTIHIACCKKCRNRIRMVDLSQVLWFVGMIGAGVVVMCSPIYAPFMDEGAVIIAGLGLLAAFAVAGWFIGKAFSKYVAKRIAKDLHVDIHEIELVEAMFRKGWFIYDNNTAGRTEEYKLFFSKKKDFKNIKPPEEFCIDIKKAE